MPARPKSPEPKNTKSDMTDFEIPGTKAPYAEEAVPEPSSILTEPIETNEEAEAVEQPEEPVEEERAQPTEEPEEPEVRTEEPEPPSKPEPYTATPSTPGQGHYYFVFVNSPATTLVKSKVSIDFDTFPTISIGRSPENVIVLPDQEVSRKHAELTMDGDRLILKDLQSKNGTYLYDGKKFQQVSDSVEVKPNCVVKFGTGTIVRLTSE